MRIVIDAGHRNSVFDFGATSANIKESVLALEITKLLAEGFKNAGHEVFFTRESENDVISLNSRIKKANRITHLDWYISIHINSFSNNSAEGFEVFHYGKEEELCQKICDNVCKSTSQKNRGAKTGNFAVLRDTYCKAMLIECGFISNPEERANLTDKTFQRKIVNGILKSFSVEPLDEPDEEHIEILLNGVIKKVEAINKNGSNFVKIRDLSDSLIEVSYDSTKKIPTVTVKNVIDN